MTEKSCVKCGVVQPLENFYKAKGTKDGYRGDCKACFAARSKTWYKANKDHVIHRVKEWREQNPEKYAEYMARYNATGKRKPADRAGHLKRRFGLTPEQYEEMLRDQHGRCAICGRVPEDGKTFHIDHDHESGVVRGLLCQPCNHALGLFQESATVLDRARSYLDPADDAEAAELTRLAKQRARDLVTAR